MRTSLHRRTCNDRCRRYTPLDIREVGPGICRINTPVSIGPGQDFSFNQYLVVDDEPLLFHTGQRQLFSLVKQAISTVIPIGKLRHVGLSHFEADETGSSSRPFEVPRAQNRT
ncbi:hypothetical protein [Povalibacter sp.]|uniref:hypothetical protein n=1 Tax=Povalibacter sp. TaxID=1962978 RepID=UPI002F3E3222